MFAPFEPARIKLDRADHHIADLTTKIGDYFKGNNAYVTFELADEFTKATGTEICAFVYRQKAPVPAMWSGIIGDAIHNMRSALDLVASDLHRVTGGKPKDAAYVHYPFCKDKDSLTEMIRSRRLSHIDREFSRLIEETAPYKGGNEGLRAVHDLDLLDKHQSLVPTISVVSLDWPVPVTDGSAFTTGISKDGQRLIVLPRAFAGNLKLGTRIKADFSIVFGDVGVLSGCDVIRQLQACIATITVITDRFSALVEQKALGGKTIPDA